MSDAPQTLHSSPPHTPGEVCNVWRSSGTILVPCSSTRPVRAFLLQGPLYEPLWGGWGGTEWCIGGLGWVDGARISVPHTRGVTPGVWGTNIRAPSTHSDTYSHHSVSELFAGRFTRVESTHRARCESLEGGAGRSQLAVHGTERSQRAGVRAFVKSHTARFWKEIVSPGKRSPPG